MTAKIAIVTGAGTGIGTSAAEHLARDGWTIVAAGRRPEPLAEVIATLDGDGHLAIPTDVSDSAAVDALFATTVEALGRIDLVFNNAGISAPPIPVDELSVEAWQRVVDINLTGSFLCARAAFVQMKKQDPQGGRIINNGSISATTPRPNLSLIHI